MLFSKNTPSAERDGFSWVGGQWGTHLGLAAGTWTFLNLITADSVFRKSLNCYFWTSLFQFSMKTFSVNEDHWCSLNIKLQGLQRGAVCVVTNAYIILPNSLGFLLQSKISVGQEVDKWNLIFFSQSNSEVTMLIWLLLLGCIISVKHWKSGNDFDFFLILCIQFGLYNVHFSGNNKYWGELHWRSV